MAVQSLGINIYDGNGFPTTQAWYGPYVGSLNDAILQVKNGWESKGLSVPIGFKFGVINPSTNKITEYIYLGDGTSAESSGSQFTSQNCKICAGDADTGGSGGEASVTITDTIPQTTGTVAVATITINGTPTVIYVPQGNSGDLVAYDLSDSTTLSNYADTTNFQDNDVPKMSLIWHLAKRVAQLEAQLNGISFHEYTPNNNDNNNG